MSVCLSTFIFLGQIFNLFSQYPLCSLSALCQVHILLDRVLHFSTIQYSKVQYQSDEVHFRGVQPSNGIFLL